MPRSCSSFRNSLATDNVRSFSKTCGAKTSPLSSPPWLGSMITSNSGCADFSAAPGVGDGLADAAGEGLGVADCDCWRAPDKSGRQSRIVPTTAARTKHCLLQSINSESAQELGVKVSRFLRQNPSGKRDSTYLLNLRAVHKERDIRPLPYPGDRFKGIPLIFHVLLVANGFF